MTRETENSLDRLFSAVDGKPTDRGPVRILGIHHDSRDRWIQIARGDDIANTIVLRVSRFAERDPCGSSGGSMEFIGDQRAAGCSCDVSGRALGTRMIEAQASDTVPSGREVLTRFLPALLA